LPLKIAGKMQEPKEREYFHELVEPHLVDGIEYLGEVTHGEKVELLQNARATLFPIEWEEPFGLVMIESMACGTPVIATRWGAGHCQASPPDQPCQRSGSSQALTRFESRRRNSLPV